MNYFLLAFIFLFLLFLVAGLYVILYATTRRDRKELFKSSTVAPSGRLIYKDSLIKGVNWFESFPSEKVTITSYDGLSLDACLISPKHPVAAVIALHGFRSWPSREFASVAQLLYENDIAVLYPFQRSHRNSEGKYITFGVKEKIDCAKWANLMAQKYPYLPMYFYGQSMGGATVLMAGQLDLPKQVHGVIADSAYCSPADVIINLLRNSYHIPAYPLIWFVDFWAIVLGGYELFKNTTQKGMRSSFRYLFIHGDIDDLVPYTMGKRNFDLCPSAEKQFLTVKGAGHCACCYKERLEYNKAILDLILNKQEG